MKVLIATDTVGDVFAYTVELAAALEAEGVEVVVATMGPRLRREQRALLPGRVHESGYRLEWMEGSWVDVAAAGRWLQILEEEERPDVVHLCSYAHGALPLAAPKVAVAHSSVLSWWRAVHGSDAPSQWGHYREQMAAGLDGADAVVAPTRAMLEELERDHRLRPGSAHVIHHGAAEPATASDVGKSALVLGAERVWDAAKNLTTLDAAAARLAWPVTVAGDLGPMGTVRFAESTGSLGPAALAELRRSASIFAAPTSYEPSGLGILAAARERCALVLGYIPSLRELWADAAIFVQPGDDRALHDVLETLIEDRSLRAQLAERAQRRAAELSIKRSARAYLKLYRRLAASAASLPPGQACV
ncbi:MAG TPA: glycosyltransferase family 4 protein [Solirubrobacterales bacterium]|nr:glycosyltransferase family 4 protein [Solirubrobacterales bacterium]